MLLLNTKIDSSNTIDGQLVLPYDLREKSRLRATLASGEEVGVFTVRGTVLRDGDLLTGDDGRVIQVVAAMEPTYKVQCPTARDLLRCAFHLGNRHTQAQVGADEAGGYLRIRQDSVLKEMLEGLGALVTPDHARFEPESGAYSGGGHHHGEAGHALAPIPLRQKIHRPSDPK